MSLKPLDVINGYISSVWLGDWIKLVKCTETENNSNICKSQNFQLNADIMGELFTFKEKEDVP